MPTGPSRCLGLTARFGLIVLVLAGCQRSGPAIQVGDERVFTTLGDFVAGYWQRPVPLQGQPPAHFSLIEASLQPADCGSCHVDQYRDWQTTVHAHAYSPGLSGQLISWEATAYQTVRSCLACHAPLSEQAGQVPDAAGLLVANPHFDPQLQRQGIVCAACHVRGWRRHGPPRRDGSLESTPGAPHGGATRSSYFEDSRFCASCHQFAEPAPGGKSLQNTLVEWQQSKYAERGMACQSCHMPDRRHLWRGIHDSAMVRSALTVEWVLGADSAGLRVINTGVGHRFPTYVTPKVRVSVELLDAERRPLEGSVAESVIGREVEATSAGWIEKWDTRLAPDSSMTVMVRAGAVGAKLARGTITVFPDGFYQGLFTRLLAGQLSDTARTLIGEAQRRTLASPYTVFEAIAPLRAR